MSSRFVSGLIACILILSVLSPGVAAAPLTVSTSNSNPAVDASHAIRETRAGPDDGSSYRDLGYGV
ncbi:hypothetical protein IW261DRAFT_1609078 [Armillaria novae-zelandiae]|uniref:Secreted protein n=1 Tax=Armillaria novae-zelandiae TaxID=153914 RepID=A0AA39P5N7_9AGAR|nr:hypothetical protein IW261DRAFT_1609078 [Armillaria novae-zelandiae]